MKLSQHIALFFIVCLFNVAFIPQLCLSAVEELTQEVPPSDDPSEEGQIGLNIFEEEAKEGQEESKTEGETFAKALEEYINYESLKLLFLSSNTSISGFSYFQYKSLILTPLSPPPDLA